MTVAVVCPNLIGDTVMATPDLPRDPGGVRRGPGRRGRQAGRRPGARRRPLVRRPDPPRPPLGRPGPADRSRRVEAPRGAGRVGGPAAELVPIGLARLAGGARRRVGYARGGRSLLLTDRLDAAPRRPGPVPADADRRLLPGPGPAPGLPRRLDPDRTLHDRPPTSRPPTPPWPRSGIGRDRPFVCLNTGGAFGPAKAGPTSISRRWRGGSRPRRASPSSSSAGPSERDAARSIVARGRPSPGRQPGRPAARASASRRPASAGRPCW